MSRIYSVIVTIMFFGSAFLTTSANAQIPPREGYKGVVSESKSKSVGEQFTFANLSGTKPFVTYPSGRGGDAIKVFENDELIVLIVVGQLTGSTETFYLSKKSQRFTLVEVTTFDAAFNPGKFADGIVRPEITYGKLQ
ncbi:MAG: hypothetical protein WA049_13355 [Ferribacterium limneticum]